jgi:hypothetical protein
MLTMHLSAERLAVDILDGFPDAGFPDARPDPDPRHEPDWGLPLLARLLAARYRTLPRRPGPDHRPVARRAVLAWADRYARPPGHPGLFDGGLAGRALGLAHAAAVEPRLGRVAYLAADRLSAADPDHYPGYDLVAGLSGAVTTLATLRPYRADRIGPPARHLAALAGTAGDDPGMAHGAAGVLAALLAAWPVVTDADRVPVARAIRRLATRLVAHSRRDARRPAWCHGTPGVAWQLAEAGRILGDTELHGVALRAMTSLADGWNDDVHLDAGTAGDRLSFCHGAAGVLAIADAFALHTGLDPARRLADHLYDLATAEVRHLVDLAAGDLSVRDGATGVLAVLLSRAPVQRGWLHVAGLR